MSFANDMRRAVREGRRRAEYGAHDMNLLADIVHRKQEYRNEEMLVHPSIRFSDGWPVDEVPYENALELGLILVAWAEIQRERREYLDSLKEADA